MLIREMHLLVSGKVQGVGFRASVKKQAQAHQICGFAKNLPDGRVEICVQGEEAQINAFLVTVESNPGLGAIEKIEKTYHPIHKKFSSFDVL